MYGRLATIYYGLGAFVLMTAFFVMQPSSLPEVASLQGNIQRNFMVAFWQTVGDQPMFEEVPLIYEAVSEFYAQSAEAAIAMVSQPEIDRDLAYIYRRTFNELVSIFQQPQATEVAAVAPMAQEKFMSEPAVYNIIPATTPVASGAGLVSGLSATRPANGELPWVTIRDNFTGQLYCLAIYNGEVNKYLGSCKYDYH